MKKIIIFSLFLFLFLSCATTGEKITSDERKSDSHYQLALNAFHEGNIIKAKIEMAKAIKYDSELPFYYNTYGLIYMREKQYKKAEKLFKKARNMDKTYTDPLNNLGVLYLKQGKLKKAREYFNKVLQDSIYPYPYFTETNLGILDRLEKKYDSSKKHFLKAIHLKGTYCEAYKELAILYDEQDLPLKAAQNYKKAVKFCPYNVEALYRGATRLLLLKENDTARKMLEMCVYINQNNVNEIEIPYLQDCVSLAKQYGIKEIDSKKVKKQINGIL